MSQEILKELKRFNSSDAKIIAKNAGLFTDELNLETFAADLTNAHQRFLEGQYVHINHSNKNRLERLEQINKTANKLAKQLGFDMDGEQYFSSPEKQALEDIAFSLRKDDIRKGSMGEDQQLIRHALSLLQDGSEAALNNIEDTRKKPLEVNPRNRFVGHGLAKVYEKHFSKKAGKSTNNEGQTDGPYIRYVLSVFEVLGLPMTPDGVASCMRHYKDEARGQKAG